MESFLLRGTATKWTEIEIKIIRSVCAGEVTEPRWQLSFMPAVQYARYRTCHGANAKKEQEGDRESSDISFTFQKYYSILDLLHKLISAGNYFSESS